MKTSSILPELRRIEIVTNRLVDGVFSGNYRSAFRGQGLEYSELRLYAEGDEARAIDWKTSAKKGELYVKKFQETRELRIIFLVDLSGSLFFGSNASVTKADLCLQVLGILGFSAAKNQDLVGALFFQESVSKIFLPKKGMAHFWEIIRAFQLRRQEMVYHRGDLIKALEETTKRFRRRSVVFLLTDHLEFSPLLEKKLKWVNLQHDLVVLRIKDPAERGNIPKGIYYLEDPESGIRKLVDFSKETDRMDFQKAMREAENRESDFLRRIGIDQIIFSDPKQILRQCLGFFRTRQKRY